MTIYSPLNNKYTKWYNSIISKAQLRGWKTRKSAGCYVEKHHIIPKSLGGSNDKINLVFLIAKEHYIVHHLLCKMFIDKSAKLKMLHSFWKICNGNKEIKELVVSRTYEKLKIERSIFLSKQMMGHKNNLGIKFTKEHKKNLSISHKGKNNTGKDWRVVSPEGEEFFIHNMAEFSRQNNLDKHRMTQVGRGESAHYKGWKCYKLPTS